MVRDEEEYIIFPIIHKNIFYNIITHLDLELKEVREMLDWIQENKIVEKQMEEDPEMAVLCEIELSNSKIIADVMNYEVWIYKRIEK
ncbi:MAG: hypothetical protein N2202_04010 [Proteobacteria bacterium]|nr:hypothetical protein [Pseudomonadota bacterium]